MKIEIPKEILYFPYTFSILILSIAFLMTLYFWLNDPLIKNIRFFTLLFFGTLLFLNWLHWRNRFYKLFQIQLDEINRKLREKREMIDKKLKEKWTETSETPREELIKWFIQENKKVQEKYENAVSQLFKSMIPFP